METNPRGAGVAPTRPFHVHAGSPRRGQEQALQAALARITVAAVGPLVAQTLTRHGVTTYVMPSERYFLKPLVTCLVNALGRG
ncbi:MAG: uroporphyrinogen-III synthase [Nitrococcus sp.]|nr:uroporphyrinogen-III synthase [Nitrococcus sp.]